MNPAAQDILDRPPRKLPRFLFPVIALPVYPVLVVYVASIGLGLYTRQITLSLPGLDTLGIFLFLFPWFLFTIGGVAGTMAIGRIPFAGLILAVAHCIGGWFFLRTAQAPPGHGMEFTEALALVGAIAVSLAYAITAPVLVAVYRRFFMPSLQPQPLPVPASTPTGYDY